MYNEKNSWNKCNLISVTSTEKWKLLTTVTVRIGSDKIGYFIMNNQKFKTWKNRLDINSQKVMRSMTFCELILLQTSKN